MNFEKIAAIAKKYQSEAKAPLGFVFRDLKTGSEISYRGNELFPTASTFKLFILAELYRRVYAGECALHDRLPLTEQIKCIGGGVLELTDAGAELTLKDYATLMMIISDNTATDVLYHFVGKENIQKNVLDPLGLTHTRCDFSCRELIDNYYEMHGRSIEQMLLDNGGAQYDYRNSKWYRCETAENNQTTPLEAAKMLQTLYHGEWISRKASDEMLTILKQCQTNGRIPYHLPEYLPIAHKTGSLDRLCADIGIVYAGEAGDYILCLYYNGNLASAQDYADDARARNAEAFLAALSGEIYRAYTE